MDIELNFNGLVERSVLMSELRQYGNVNDKIYRLVRDGELVRVIRGKYITKAALESGGISKYQVANALYSPSYISFFSALEFHGIIPERVDTVESATVVKSKNYNTPIGNFRYRKMKSRLFSYGVLHHISGDIGFLIASPTKALIDILWTEDVLKIYGTKRLYHYLTEDLRIEEESLHTLDVELLEYCARRGPRARILNLLLDLLKKRI